MTLFALIKCLVSSDGTVTLLPRAFREADDAKKEMLCDVNFEIEAYELSGDVHLPEESHAGTWSAEVKFANGDKIVWKVAGMDLAGQEEGGKE